MEVKVGPPTMVQAEPHSLDEHEARPIGDNPEVIRGAAVGKRLMAVRPLSGPDGKASCDQARDSPAGHPAYHQRIVESAADQGHRNDIPEKP